MLPFNFAFRNSVYEINWMWYVLDHPFKVNESLHKADEVTIYCLQKGFYVGLWNSSLSVSISFEL